MKFVVDQCKPVRTTKLISVSGHAGTSPHFTGNRGAFNRSMQHHLINLLFRDGVYERRETREAFSHAENRDLEPLEGWAVVA